MTTKADLLNILSRHQSQHNGIGVRYLAAQLRTSARDVRHLISECREEGVAICAHPSTGYFIATTPEELLATCAFLEDRAMHTLRLLGRMRRCLPELMGQTKLNQA